MAIESTTVERINERAGKYLTFTLADEEYGLEILKVREIIGMMDITAVPRMPDFVKGVINLRGRVIPVVDLRLKFSMPQAEYTEKTCIIIVNAGNIDTGIIVDEVSEVLDISAEEIEDSPAFGANVNTDFIIGMGKSEDRVTILLDIDKVLTRADLAATAQAAESQENLSADADDDIGQKTTENLRT